MIEFIEVRKDQVCVNCSDQILDHRIEQLCNKCILLMIIPWAEDTSLDRINENQVSIYACDNVAYTDKHHKFRGRNLLGGRQ